MQMIVKQNAHQPVKITLRGNLSEEDAHILRQECLNLEHHLNPCQIWIYLENIGLFHEHDYIVFHQIFMLFQQSGFQMSLITKNKSLCKRLLERGLPAQYYAPNPILHQANVY